MRPLLALLIAPLFAAGLFAADKEPLFKKTLNVNIPHINTDKTVKYDYDIVYVRAKRAGDEIHKRFYTDFSQPVTMEPGADLMLLHPDGREELLVKGGDGSITDPVVSFDAQWVYFVHIDNLQHRSQWNPPRQGADIFKIHLKSRKIVRLTNQKFTPNTGAANWSSDFRKSERGKTYYDYGVFNMGPCPLPGGRIAFTSNRDGFRPAKGYPAIALQLFVMDDRDASIGANDDPRNLEKIGHLNISGALHPVALKDGRIMFSTLESQGIRSNISWGIWTIHPDGTQWTPLVSAFDPGGASNGFHFQAQLSDESIVVEEYYNQNNSGFGAYIKLPPKVRKGYPQFGPGYMRDPRNKPWRYGRFYNAKGQWYRMPFMPAESVSLTPFSHGREGPANHADLNDKNSPRVGKFTHPSGAPDNHLLTVYSPGPVNHQYKFLPQLDGGIYLLKKGEIVTEPAQLRLIKNDPDYNESWPRAVVPYERIYGVKEPKRLKPLANDGSLSKQLPAGSPFGLIGTSSLYKRESYPNGVVPPGKVTAEAAEIVKKRDPWKGLDAFTSHGNGMPLNWHNQGGDAGLYSNSDIVAVRILAMEPTTDRQRGANSGRRFFNHASERLRILGEIPVRKFAARTPASSRRRGSRNTQPLDPDHNPDTSFLAKIPADTAFTFQTLDKDGMVLNMSQTWHQLRPGEIRHDCGGCHAHSQQPTEFKDTFAARPDYKIWDLTKSTPLLTSKPRSRIRKNSAGGAKTGGILTNSATNRQWDYTDTVGLKYAKSEVVNVEYFHDVQPILLRSCAACHSKKSKEPAGNLVLDADDERVQYRQFGKFPGTYYRIALDEAAKFGHKPFGYDSWGYPNASRYIRQFQSRRSLLVWKLFGKRLDGFSNDDHPSPAKPGDRTTLLKAGKPVDPKRNRARWDLDYEGSIMPPPAAVKAGKVKPLSDEDRRTLVRWIDLGCPIDLDYDAAKPQAAGYGWMLDDNRPILTMAVPQPGRNAKLDRILIGMHDYYSGLDEKSLTVTANFPLDGVPPGTNLASRFKPKSPGVRELRLSRPAGPLRSGEITVSVRDRQGNVSKIVRTISVESVRTARPDLREPNDVQ
jgi:Hydrazine synthase alpha subunit middle domain